MFASHTLVAVSHRSMRLAPMIWCIRDLWSIARHQGLYMTSFPGLSQPQAQRLPKNLAVYLSGRKVIWWPTSIWCHGAQGKQQTWYVTVVRSFATYTHRHIVAASWTTGSVAELAAARKEYIHTWQTRVSLSQWSSEPLDPWTPLPSLISARCSTSPDMDTVSGSKQEEYVELVMLFCHKSITYEGWYST